MSVTKDEAIKWLEEIVQDTDTYWGSCSKALQKELDEQKQVFLLALSALRPITREQIAEVFPGCDFCNIADFGEFGFEITKHYAKIACALGSWRFPQHEQFLFCPKCGKPLTDKAVDMVMERLEALRDE